MFPPIICQIKTCPRMTHHMLSTLKPLIDVMAPGGTLVSNIQLVFFIREKHWKNFLTFTPKPEITHVNKLFVMVSHWRDRASLTEEQFWSLGNAKGANKDAKIYVGLGPTPCTIICFVLKQYALTNYATEIDPIINSCQLKIILQVLKQAWLILFLRW